jgi:hypothetical protein
MRFSGTIPADALATPVVVDPFGAITRVARRCSCGGWFAEGAPDGV